MLSTLTFNIEASKGLVMYSSAPAAYPSLISFVPVLAVTMMIGIWLVFMSFFSCRISSIPFIFGIIRSVIIRFGSRLMALASASSPLVTPITLYLSARQEQI